MKHVHQKYVKNNCWCLLLVLVIVRHDVFVSDSGSNHQPPPKKQINCSVVRIDGLIDKHRMWCGASHSHYLLGISLSLSPCVCEVPAGQRGHRLTDLQTVVIIHRWGPPLIINCSLHNQTKVCACVCVWLSVSACLHTTLSQFFSLFPKSILATVFHVTYWFLHEPPPQGPLLEDSVLRL